MLGPYGSAPFDVSRFVLKWKTIESESFLLTNGIIAAKSAATVHNRQLWVLSRTLYHAIYRRSCYLCGLEIYANFAKITHHKIYAGDIYAILINFNYWGCVTYVLKFISNFNYANFLSLA